MFTRNEDGSLNSDHAITPDMWINVYSRVALYYPAADREAYRRYVEELRMLVNEFSNTASMMWDRAVASDTRRRVVCDMTEIDWALMVRHEIAHGTVSSLSQLLGMIDRDGARYGIMAYGVANAILMAYDKLGAAGAKRLFTFLAKHLYNAEVGNILIRLLRVGVTGELVEAVVAHFKAGHVPYAQYPKLTEDGDDMPAYPPSTLWGEVIRFAKRGDDYAVDCLLPLIARLPQEG